MESPLKPEPAYVYLAVHATEPILKIGKALTPSSRLKEIDEPFLAEASLLLECSDIDSAFALEKALQRIARRFQEPRRRSSGGTEWFSLDALPAIHSVLAVIRAHSLFAITEHTLPANAPKPIDPDLIRVAASRSGMRSSQRELRAANIGRLRAISLREPFFDNIQIECDNVAGTLKITAGDATLRTLEQTFNEWAWASYPSPEPSARPILEHARTFSIKTRRERDDESCSYLVTINHDVVDRLEFTDRQAARLWRRFISGIIARSTQISRPVESPDERLTTRDCGLRFKPGHAGPRFFASPM